RAPQSDNHLVIDTAAGANFIGKQSAVNSAGTDSMLRQGVLLDLAGMPLRESAQINTNTAGTGSGYLVNSASLAVGDTTIPADTGTGTVLAGDIVTFAGDTNKYVVATALSGGSFTIAAPGLLAAPADNAAITVVVAAARNMCFNRSALVLAARAPARPVEGDAAQDVMVITDPRSGLALEFSLYTGYRKVRYEVALAWGVKNIKPEHTALLLG
ncbi:MAG TPA: P22 coat - protein 5 family protein, partial [Porticoccaceae bacterium]|nr:P22 coat - protein 5 family protein [Porticoccaceae bacterium]